MARSASRVVALVLGMTIGICAGKLPPVPICSPATIKRWHHNSHGKIMPKCNITTPKDPNFFPVCVNRSEGAEPPTNRCAGIGKKAGIFTCACCGRPLFSSEAFCNAETGWPAFTLAVRNNTAVCHPAPGITSIACTSCGAHLGDWFPNSGRSGKCKYDGEPSHFCIDGVCLDPPEPNAPHWGKGCTHSHNHDHPHAHDHPHDHSSAMVAHN